MYAGEGIKKLPVAVMLKDFYHNGSGSCPAHLTRTRGRSAHPAQPRVTGIAALTGPGVDEYHRALVGWVVRIDANEI
jgi:hypothetical protein